MKKLYILLFDLGYYPEEHWVKTISAFDLDEAKHLVLNEEDSIPKKDEWTIETLNDMLSEWIEIPIQVSKKGTYFPKPVTHIINGDGSKTKAIEILYNKEV